MSGGPAAPDLVSVSRVQRVDAGGPVSARPPLSARLKEILENKKCQMILNPRWFVTQIPINVPFVFKRMCRECRQNIFLTDASNIFKSDVAVIKTDIQNGVNELFL